MKTEHEDLSPDAERFGRIIEALDRRPVRLPARMRAAVMARIRAERSSAWVRTWTWLAEPRLSPLAAGVALAAGIVALLLFRPQVQTGSRELAGAGSVTVPVRLVFLAPQAARVAVTGDFVRWDPTGIPLVGPHQNGVWSVELQLSPGLHHYIFIVDGTEWRPDPNAASQVDDGFGQKNTVLLVPVQKVS